MPRLRRSILAVLSLLAVCNTSTAQYRFDKAIRLVDDIKLTASNTRSIRMSKDGFIWFGTSDGLCRFDGQSYKMFRHHPNDSNSLYDETIHAVMPYGNEIWVATGKGISVMNTSTEKFRHYQIDENGKTPNLNRDRENLVSALHTDRQGNIWVGTRLHGAWLYDPKSDAFKKFSFDPSSYQPIIPRLTNNMNALSIECNKRNDSIIYIGTAAGLEEINKYSGDVKWYTYPQKDKDYQTSLNAFRRLYYHDDGLLYTGSWGAGVNIFNPVTKSFVPLPIANQPGAAILKSPIAHIIRKSAHEIWITSVNGLVVYDTDAKSIIFSKASDAIKNEFYGAEYIDSLNRVWFANINGVYYYDPIMQQFARHSYEQLYGNTWSYAFYVLPDATGNLLTVCPRAADGLYLFDKTTHTWSKQLFGPAAPRLTVRGFAKLNSAQYVLSSDEGIYTYDIASKRLKPFHSITKTKYNQWSGLLVDHAGDLWISANTDGLLYRNMKTGEDRLLNAEIAVNNETTPFKPNHLFEDSQHNIWFSTVSGFSVYVRAADSIINFPYTRGSTNSFPTVAGFAEDKKGRVWINTTDEWTGYGNAATPQKGIVKKIRLGDFGISGKMIQVATDRDGYVWAYNDETLFRIKEPDQPFELFSFQYGITKVDFFHFSFLPSGEMILGGRNDITIADPKELRRNTELPVPYVSGIKVLNHQVDPSALHHASSLKLKHNENFLSIAFSARAYSMAEGTRFRYRMIGFNDWNEATTERIATYTNIPPGDYTFQLQAANNEGQWNTSILEIPVSIATPWWQTWWFRIAIVALVVGLIGWVYRYRVDQVRKKEQVRSQYEKKLANVEMSALLAQMNPHFLFNSLNSIDSYIIKNESKKASEYLNNFARLMRLILQNSRSNYISLKDELEALDLYLQMESLRFNNRFTYSIVTGDSVETSSTLIPPMLIQPYVENAIWHGLMHKNDGSIGKVEINLAKKENNLFCIIEDNGVGREKAMAQKSTNRKRSMGMQITKDRMEMINKLYNTTTTMQIIDLEDEAGNAKGTRVELVIPV